MLKIVTRLLISIVLLSIIAVTAGVILTLVIDPNHYRDEISTSLSKAIGKPVHVKGSVELELFPLIHVVANDILVESPPSFGAELLKIDSITAGVSVVPLLKGEFDIGAITLINPRLNLITHFNGETNWELLPSSSDSDSDSDNDQSKLPALLISNVSVSGGTVRWKNLQDKQEIYAEQINLDMGAFIPGQPVDIKLAAVVYDSNSEMEAKISTQTDVIVDLDNKQITFRSVDINADIQESTESQSLPLQLSGNGIYDHDKNSLTMDTLHLDLPGLQAKAKLKVDSVSDNAVVHFTLHESKLTAKEIPDFILANSQDLPSHISIQASGLINNKDINIDNLNLHADGADIRGSGTIKAYRGTPKINASVTFDMDALDLREAPKAHPKTTPAAGQNGKPAANNTHIIAGTLFPLTQDYQIALQAQISIKKLQLAALDINNARATIRANNQSLKIAIPETALFGGVYAGNLKANITSPNRIAWQADGKISNLDIAQATSDLDHKSSLHGTGNIQYQLTGTGITESEIRKSLNGNMRVSVTNGGLLGPRLEKVLRKALLLLAENKLSQKDNVLRIQTLETDVVFNNGVAENRTLQIKTPLLYVQGTGKTNLVSTAIHYRLSLELIRSDSDDTVKLPLLISGTMNKPKYSLISSVVKQKIKKEVLDQNIGKLGKTLNKKIGEALNKLKLRF